MTSDSDASSGMDSRRITIGIRLFQVLERIRAFDDAIIASRTREEIHGVVHPVRGQEACAAGVCMALGPGDQVVSTFRGLGHQIALGIDTGRLLAEYMGRVDGICSGRSGSQHIAAKEQGLLNSNGIVAGGLPIALGSALASCLDADGTITVCFFSEGAFGQGVLFECLHMAALWRLPILFVCENNQYAADVAVSEHFGQGSLTDLVEAFGIAAEATDGNDAFQVLDAASRAIKSIRSNRTPYFLELSTYRGTFHAMRGTVPPDGRPIDERSIWDSRDPLAIMRQHLEAMGVDSLVLDSYHDEAADEVARAISFALTSPFPDPSEPDIHASGSWDR